MQPNEIIALLHSSISKENYPQYIVAIEYLNHQYYDLSQQVISDREFDELFKKVQDFEEAHPELDSSQSPTQQVAKGTQSTFAKVNHLVPMLSLANSYDEEDLDDFDTSVKKGLNDAKYSYYVEPKFDGSSISLVYENNKLVRAATRGNGSTGEDITLNAKQVKHIPTQVDFLSIGYKTVELRGEVVINRKTFEEMNEQREKDGLSTFQNTRNTASGSLRLKDTNEVKNRNLEAFIYAVGYSETATGSTELVTSQEHTLNLLDKLGFQSAKNLGKACETISDVLAFCHKWEEERMKFDYDIDGMVIKVNKIPQQLELGTTSHHPKWAIAFKFKAIEKRTKLLTIEYQVGRTGIVTPVAKVEPVEVGGVTVKSISLHNEDNIVSKDIHIGDYVYIERAGDVIPQITRVDFESRTNDLLPFQYVQNCPSCNSELVRYEGEAAWRCTNPICPAQNLEKIIYFVSKSAMNIQGLGKDIVKRFVELHIITDIVSIYELDYDKILSLEGWQERSVTALRQSIEDSKSNDISRLMVGLGIDNVGTTMSKFLAAQVDKIQDFQNWDIERFEALDDVGPKMAESLYNFFHNENNIDVLNRLESLGVNTKSSQVNSTGSLYGKKIVFTGFRDGDLEASIEAEGGFVANSLSKKTDILIVKEKGSGSSKEKKAEEYGVEILSVDAFREEYIK